MAFKPFERRITGRVRFLKNAWVLGAKSERRKTSGYLGQARGAKSVV
jgi:hypothetical protein